jgi:hypothetical protein
MTLLGASAFAFAPAAVATLKDAIEPIIVIRSENPFVKKMKHFFCLELSNLYFSFFHDLNQFLF